MPFDEGPENSGGGGSDRHDPEGLRLVVHAALMQLSLNCEANDLCEFHAGVLMQATMIDGLCATFDKQPDSTSAQQMIADQLDLISRSITQLDDIIEKHRTPLN